MYRRSLRGAAGAGRQSSVPRVWAVGCL